MKGQRENQVAIVVGGTSGLGLELARRLRETHTVVVMGRDRQKGKALAKAEGFAFSGFTIRDLDDAEWPNMDETIKEHCNSEGRVLDLVVYAAGTRQDSLLDDLEDDELGTLLGVGLVAPIFALQEVLQVTKTIPNLIVVTSSAASTPRMNEAVYCATKAGLTMFAEALSLDPRVGKTLVAAPSGMKTAFWFGSNKDTEDFLDPAWVADEIMKTWQNDFAYREERYLRGPARVETAKVRL